MNSVAFKVALVKRGMTMKDAAEKAGLSVSTIHDMVKNRRDIRVSTADLLKNRIGLSRDEFFDIFFTTG